MSILFALVAALSFALHSLFYKLVLVHFEVNLTQLMYDSAAIFAIILLPGLVMKVMVL